jgi:hypothetical protein
VLAVALLLASCGASTPAPLASEAPGHPPETAAYPGSPAASGAPAVSAIPPVSGTTVALTGWEVTVYYTAVATLHTDDPVAVSGCPTIDCEKSRNQQELGTFPSSFVKAVKDEGTGRTADGRYLNWSYDTGYWMDTAPATRRGARCAPGG